MTVNKQTKKWEFKPGEAVGYSVLALMLGSVLTLWFLERK